MSSLLDLKISVRPPRGAPLVVAGFQDEAPETANLPAPLATRLRRLRAGSGWAGRRKQETPVQVTGWPAPVAVHGLGPRQGCDDGHVADWLDRVLKAALQGSHRRIAIALPAHPTTTGTAAAAALGRRVVLAGYRFDRFRSEGSEPRLAEVHLIPPQGEHGVYREAAVTARAIAEAAATARDLANTPPNEATPAWMAAQAKAWAERVGAKTRILTPAHLERRGMGAILAVGRGSANKPRLVRLEWGSGKRRIALVGKGVTFDTGGISLKPPKSMEDMKYDKSGACAVLGIAQGAAALDLPFRFRAYLALAENMPDADAYRPSDIVKTYSGKTVEVLNTDAEGRMILADALAWAVEEGAESVIELSTLTGATVVALGRHAAALYTPDDELAAELLDAGAASGERLWRMPLWREHADEMRGTHADLRNVAGRWGGANTAAAFLGEFVGEHKRWAHLDIAGTAYVGSDDAGRSGGTGYGVALVLSWLLRQAGRL